MTPKQPVTPTHRRSHLATTALTTLLALGYGAVNLQPLSSSTPSPAVPSVIHLPAALAYCAPSVGCAE